MLPSLARRAWAVALNLVGIVLVGLDLAQRDLAQRDAHGSALPIAVVAWVSWALWLINLFLPQSWVPVRAPIFVAMALGGSFAGAATDVVGMVPAAVALISLGGTLAFPLRLAGLAGAGSVVAIVLGETVDPAAHSALISVAALLLVCGIGGLSRRQYRVAEAQSLALLEERLAVEQERAEVAALIERSRIARDLHDVLAHSLGALVIQLETVDALLEAEHVGDAAVRVRAARDLAVTGLDEARRAVSALREPDEPLSEMVADLAATHRSIGGQVVVHGDADDGVLGVPGRLAARRAVQELLTNARRHAPGARTTLDLVWRDDMLVIVSSTPPGASGHGHERHGGGRGLRGMRERVAEAGGTMDVHEGPPFEVVLSLPGERPA